MFSVSLGAILTPSRNWRQCLCKILGWEIKRIMVCYGISGVVNWNIWPLLVVNNLVSEQTQAMQDCHNPWFLGLSSFLWKGVVFINEYCIKNVSLSSSCMLVTNIFPFRWVIEFFLHCYSVWWEPCGIVGTVC